jgi:hypothetical protein
LEGLGRLATNQALSLLRLRSILILLQLLLLLLLLLLTVNSSSPVTDTVPVPTLSFSETQENAAKDSKRKLVPKEVKFDAVRKTRKLSFQEYKTRSATIEENRKGHDIESLKKTAWYRDKSNINIRCAVKECGRTTSFYCVQCTSVTYFPGRLVAICKECEHAHVDYEKSLLKN